MQRPAPPVGSRIVVANSVGTIRYIGPVKGHSETWYGVEWDDPSRGKHDGTVNGHKYFNCLRPGSGSFIRPTAPIQYGQSFLSALVSKYNEALHGHHAKETVILGSSNGAIEVEAVGLDKIRSKLADFRYMRQASLETEFVAFPDPPDKINSTCPYIRRLDLSHSLLSSWEEVATIATGLIKLESLSLNFNRFSPLTTLQNPSLLGDAFSSLKELYLNQALLSWADAQFLIDKLPELRVLELGYNELRVLGGLDHSPDIPPKLESLNFDTNLLEDWDSLMDSIRAYSGLKHIVLASNYISTIPQPSNGGINTSVEHLSLSSNQLSHWSDIDALSRWFPNLKNSTIQGNPLNQDRNSFRQWAIAKIPSLDVLDGTKITSQERQDSELLYLSHIAENAQLTDAEKLAQHPQWAELCRKYGIPESKVSSRLKTDILGNNLIEVTVFRSNLEPIQPIVQPVQASAALTVRVLATMKLIIFRRMLMKLLKVAGDRRGLRIWLQTGDSWTELDDDRKPLDWWGVENYSSLLAFVPVSS